MFSLPGLQSDVFSLLTKLKQQRTVTRFSRMDAAGSPAKTNLKITNILIIDFTTELF